MPCFRLEDSGGATRNIFLTGGIGDILALSSWEEFPKDIGTFYWASRGRPDLEPLFAKVYLKAKHVNLWSDLTPEEERLVYKNGDKATRRNICPEGVEDFCIHKKFFTLSQYVGCPLLRISCGNIKKFALPEKFILIQGDSSWNAPACREQHHRIYDGWKETLAWLEAHKLHGVCVGAPGDVPPPEHELLLNLVAKTTLGQSIEILKSAQGYRGIDSWAACLACQLWKSHSLHITTGNFHYMMFKRIYCAPHKEFDFVHMWEKKLEPIAIPKPKMKYLISLIRRVVNNSWIELGDTYEINEQDARRHIAEKKALPLETNTHMWVKLKKKMKVAGKEVEAGNICEVNETLAKYLLASGLAEDHEKYLTSAKMKYSQAIRENFANKAVIYE